MGIDDDWWKSKKDIGKSFIIIEFIFCICILIIFIVFFIWVFGLISDSIAEQGLKGITESLWYGQGGK